MRRLTIFLIASSIVSCVYTAVLLSSGAVAQIDSDDSHTLQQTAGSVHELSIYQFIRHLQSFGSGRHSRSRLMARRRPRVNQESLPRASLAGWRSGRFFSAGAGLLAWSHMPVETAQ